MIKFASLNTLDMLQMDDITTLDEFIIKSQKKYTHATGQLTRLLRDIGIAAKIVNHAVNKAGLINIIGVAGTDNASGDEVQKLDMYANDIFIECLKKSGECGGIASEEDENIILLEPVAERTSDYVLVMDPLDGSSNIDVNVSVGTIFGIYRRKTDTSGKCDLSDFLQKGTELIAAGYVLYGTSTMLVYSTGEGVNGFTLEPSIGEFCLSHRNMKIPSTGKYYSVNQGYYKLFDPEIQKYIDHCSEQNIGLRYIGSMVSDIHRSMFKGGVFMYPNTTKNPEGKLRMLYECNPMAYIIEQAGGMAVNTKMERILDLEVTELHQRSPIVIGSKDMVEEVGRFVEEYGNIEV